MDSLAPSVHQVRVVGDEVWVEVSEEVREEAIAAAVGDGGLALVDTTSGDALSFVWEQPVTTGKQARRRVVLRVDPADVASWPTAGQDVELQVAAAALEDLFGNTASADYSVSFAWPSGDLVVEDTAAPRVEQVAVLEDGLLEVRLSESVDLVAFGAELLADGQPLTWVAGADGYAVQTDSGLAAGSYDLVLGTGGIDLSGKGLDEAFATSVNVSSGGGAAISATLVYEEPDSALVEASTIGNRIGFHGLDADPVTGLVYARNRHFDPGIGRFLSTDPYGYSDSPSMYQYGMNNPFNYTDPMGTDAFIINYGPQEENTEVYVTVRFLRKQWDTSLSDQDFAAAVSNFNEGSRTAWAALQPTVINVASRSITRDRYNRTVLESGGPEPFVTDVLLESGFGLSSMRSMFVGSMLSNSQVSAHEFGHHLGLEDYGTRVTERSPDGGIRNKFVNDPETFGDRGENSIMGNLEKGPASEDLRDIRAPGFTAPFESSRAAERVHHLDVAGQDISAAASFLSRVASARGRDVSSLLATLRSKETPEGRRLVVRLIMNRLFRQP